MTGNHTYTPGEEVEWVMRPTGGGGYLRGIVVKLGPSKIGIAVQSTRTGEWYGKWVHPLSLRKTGHNP